MRLPFTIEQFLEVFRRYNEALWPAQWVLLGAAVLAVAAARRGARGESRFAAAVLAALWIWMAVAYHLAFFAAINPAAYLFAALSLAEGLLMARAATGQRGLELRIRPDVRGVVGAALVLHALIGYPLSSLAAGHRYPAMPTFGLPCPTTIFTFGVLCWARPRAPWSLLAVPVVWSIVGTSAATSLGMREDLALPASALLAIVVATGRGMRLSLTRARAAAD